MTNVLFICKISTDRTKRKQGKLQRLKNPTG